VPHPGPRLYRPYARRLAAARVRGYRCSFPLLLSASVLTFLLSLTIAMSPNEAEILADATLSERLAPEPVPELERPSLAERWDSLLSLASRAWRAWRRIRDSNS
jgi:hypothetical protein